MKSSQRVLLTNWTLLALASLLLVAVVATSGLLSSGERQARARHLMVAFRLDEVRELTLRSNEQRLVVRRRAADEAGGEAASGAADDRGGLRSGARWLLVEPLEVEAEEGRVDQLLRDLRFATWERQIPAEAVDERAFGLLQPDAVIEVQMGQVRYVLQLGGPAPAPAGTKYLRVSGERVPNAGVYVVSKSTAEALTVGLSELRVRQVVPYGRSAMVRVKLTQGAQTVIFERQAATAGGAEPGEWFRFVGRFGGARVNAEVIDRVFWSLARSEARHFLEPAQAEAAQSGQQLLTLAIETRDAATFELRYGGVCPQDDTLGVVTRHGGEPMSACVAAVELGELLRRPEMLIDRRLFSLRVDEVEQLQVVQGNKQMELLRREDGFVLREPLEGEVERDLGQQRLETILAARGQWLEQVPAPLSPDSLAHSVTLTSSGAAADAVREQRVSLSAPEADGSCFAYRHQDGAWLKLAPVTVRAMQPDALLIRSRQLVELQDREVKRVEVRSSSWRQVLEQPQRGEFHLLSPPDYPVDAGLAVELVDELARLTLERWVSAQRLPQFGLSEPRLEVTLDSDAGRVLTLRVGAAATEGGFYASRDGDPAVFTLRAATVERLETLLISRSLLMVDASELVALQLRTPSRRLELSRLGVDLVQVGGAEQLPAPRIEELLDALGMIRPEAAIAFDANAQKYGFERPVLEVTAQQRAKPPLEWWVGARDLYRDMSVYYVRLKDKPAVFVVPRQHLSAILEALR